MVVHNETATGVTSNIGAVRKAIDAAGHPAMLFVDGVSSIGSLPFYADEWKVDCAIAGSQKGLMLPAGLGVICVSQKALKAAEGQSGRNDRLARVYFDWEDHKKQNPAGYFPTPRRCRCSTACARRSPACSRKAWRTSITATPCSARRPARPSRPGA